MSLKCLEWLIPALMEAGRRQGYRECAEITRKCADIPACYAIADMQYALPEAFDSRK